MEYSLNNKGGHCRVAMNGQFIFSDNRHFRQIMEVLDGGTISITLDLRAVNFVDSAALGMLLLLRDRAVSKGAEITLAYPQEQVKKLFAVSRFTDLFTIEE